MSLSRSVCKRNIKHIKQFQGNEDHAPLLLPVPAPESETHAENPEDMASGTRMELPPSKNPGTETETAVLRRSGRITKPTEYLKIIATKAFNICHMEKQYELN